MATSETFTLGEEHKWSSDLNATIAIHDPLDLCMDLEYKLVLDARVVLDN